MRAEGAESFGQAGGAAPSLTPRRMPSRVFDWARVAVLCVVSLQRPPGSLTPVPSPLCPGAIPSAFVLTSRFALLCAQVMTQSTLNQVAPPKGSTSQTVTQLLTGIAGCAHTTPHIQTHRHPCLQLEATRTHTNCTCVLWQTIAHGSSPSRIMMMANDEQTGAQTSCTCTSSRGTRRCMGNCGGRKTSCGCGGTRRRRQRAGRRPRRRRPPRSKSKRSVH